MKTDRTDTARQAFFNQRAHAWLGRHYKDEETGEFDLHRDRINTIINTLDIGPDHCILDLGCGAGVLVPYILERLSPRGQLFEVDYAEEMIRANQSVHQDDRIRFHCAHVLDMGFDPNSFDAVVCFACFPHFQDPEKAVKEIAQVLKPGGTLTVAHLMSSQELAAHHQTETAVSDDSLPSKEWMHTHFEKNSLNITSFTDAPGLFCLTAVRDGNRINPA